MAPRIIHCSYHKCLTAYYGTVMGGLYNRIFRFTRGHHHFNSRINEFHERAGEPLRGGQEIQRRRPHPKPHRRSVESVVHTARRKAFPRPTRTDPPAVRLHVNPHGLGSAARCRYNHATQAAGSYEVRCPFRLIESRKPDAPTVVTRSTCMVKSRCRRRRARSAKAMCRSRRRSARCC